MLAILLLHRCSPMFFNKKQENVAMMVFLSLAASSTGGWLPSSMENLGMSESLLTLLDPLNTNWGRQIRLSLFSNC